MLKQLAIRQRIRKAILVVNFLVFPITLNFLSPYVIIDGAMIGIINGSFIMFGLMFISSLFLGRLWCGWICPGGAVQDLVEPINRHNVSGRRMNWIKWLIWIPWISLIIFSVVRAGGYKVVDFLHLTESGISVDEPIKFITYYLVIFLLIILPIIFGRRAACHSICWMAPFMMIGRWIRNRFSWPSLRLKTNKELCISCKSCEKNCPMSLSVNQMVQIKSMENSECILCGTCVDVCPKEVIRYSFSKGK